MSANEHNFQIQSEEHDYPWRHVTAQCDYVNDLCLQVHADALKLSNYTPDDQANYGVENADSILYWEHKDHLCMVLQQIATKHFGDYVKSNGHWHVGLTEANMVNSKMHGADLIRETGILLPHTDDPEELRRENIKYGRDALSIGLIKCVIYCADDSLDYSDYGTKLYVSLNNPLDPQETNFPEFSKEIKFKNGLIFMWAPGKDTWHGTDYSSHLDHRRIFFTGEYY
jgi:hypothetical protein